MDANFIAGLISGIAATLIGFLLTLAWDVRKARREHWERDTAAFLALTREMEDHVAIAKANSSDLQIESAIVANKQMLIKPLKPFNGRTWDLLALNLPTRLLSDGELLTLMRSVSAAATSLNEAMSSRQRFKDTSQALSNFSDILGKMDADLASGMALIRHDAELALAKSQGHLGAA